MKKILIFLFAIFSAQSGFCCAIPNFGPEFDKLIEITKLEKDGEFYIEIPRLDYPKKPKIYIETYTLDSYDLLINGPIKKRLDAGEAVSGEEHNKELIASQPEKRERLWWLKTKNNRVFKKFKINLKKDLVHRVYVYWPVECCLCSTQAFSKPLEQLQSTE